MKLLLEQVFGTHSWVTDNFITLALVVLISILRLTFTLQMLLVEVVESMFLLLMHVEKA